MELISKEKMLEKLAMLPADQFYNLASIKNFIKAEEEAVVRCRDCKHHTAPWYCEAWNNSPGFPAVGGNGFCFLGERREE